MIVVQHMIDAVSLGALYALAALGIGLIFGIMRLINFAHGELFMVGGYCLFLLAGYPEIVMALAAILVVLIAALGMERFAFRPIRGASPATLLVMSFALSYFLQHVVIIVFDARPKGIDFLGFLSHSLELGGLRVPLLQIAIVASTAVLLTLFSLVYKRSSIGVQMRAAAEDFVMARLVGVPSNRVIAAAFACAGFLAAVVSLFYVAQRGSIAPDMGVNMVIIAFVATVIGGMGSIAGAALGGCLVGMVSVALQAALPVDFRPYRDAFVFAIFLAFLFLRPEGIMARRADRERV